MPGGASARSTGATIPTAWPARSSMRAFCCPVRPGMTALRPPKPGRPRIRIRPDPSHADRVPRSVARNGTRRGVRDAAPPRTAAMPVRRDFARSPAAGRLCVSGCRRGRSGRCSRERGPTGMRRSWSTGRFRRRRPTASRRIFRLRSGGAFRSDWTSRFSAGWLN